MIYCGTLWSYQTTNQFLRNWNFYGLHDAHNSRWWNGRRRLRYSRWLCYPRRLRNAGRLRQSGQSHLRISTWHRRQTWWHCRWRGCAPSQWAALRKEGFLDQWLSPVYITNNGHIPRRVTGSMVDLHLASNLEADALDGLPSSANESLQLSGAHLNDLEVLRVDSWWTLGLSARLICHQVREPLRHMLSAGPSSATSSTTTTSATSAVVIPFRGPPVDFAVMVILG
mmetsp:Transcript_32576/g.59536  ORF Transcript_32576/g.59536 Transcript_32576/m.59536 type:complete len:226 (-) Transcript_32576:1309-1986(-)